MQQKSDIVLKFVGQQRTPAEIPSMCVKPVRRAIRSKLPVREGLKSKRQSFYRLVVLKGTAACAKSNARFRQLRKNLQLMKLFGKPCW